MADNTIDTLDIQISSSTEKAVRALTNLSNKLTEVNSALSGVNTNGLRSCVRELGKLKELDIGKMTNIADGIGKFSNSIKTMSGVDYKGSGLNAVINSINRLSQVDVSGFDSGKLGEIIHKLSNLAEIPDVSSGVNRFVNSMARLANSGEYIANVSAELPALGSNLKFITESFIGVDGISDSVNRFVQSIAQLASAGNKIGQTSSQLGTLANEVLSFFNVMKTAPRISENTIRMTEALAQLATASGKINKATNSLSNSFSRLSNSTNGLGNAGKKLSSMIGAASSALTGFGNNANVTSKKVGSLTSQLAGLYAKFFTVTRGIKALWNSVNSASDYVETLNYFNSAFDQVTDGLDISKWQNAGVKSAEEYVGSFEKRAKELTKKMTGFEVSDAGDLTRTKGVSLGLDPKQTMNYQATYAQMASSMGATADASTKVSQALTEIGADLASVKNLEFNDVWNDMASGITGMSRALDKYGINIRVANLQQELYNLGIDATVSSLSQSDKAILRTITILNSSKYAWADLASTINQPANQVRMLKSNFEALGRSIGTLFLPIVAKVLPYINGLVMALERAFSWLAKLLGIKLSDYVSSTGKASVDMGDIADSTDNAASGLDNANDNAKKLQKTLSVLSFDELNQLNDNKTSSSSGSSGSGALGSAHIPELDAAFDKALSDYQKAWDQAFANVENKAQTVSDKIIKAFKQIRKNAKPTTAAIKKLYNEGLSRLGNFSINALKNLWKNYLQPIGKWSLSNNSGLPRFFNITNDLLTKINWLKLQTSLEGLFTMLQKPTQFVWTGLMDFYEHFLVPVGTWTMNGAIPQLVDALTSFGNNIHWEELNKSLKNFWDALAPFAKNVGQGIVDFYKDLLNVGENFINSTVPGGLNSIAEAIKNISPETAQAIGKSLGQISLAILGFKGLTFIGGIIGKDSPLGKGLSLLAKHPYASMALGIGGIVLALDNFGVIDVDWEWIWSSIDRVKTSIQNFIDKVDWNAVGTALGNLWSAFQPFAEGFADALITGLEGIINIGADLINGIANAINWLAEKLSGIDPEFIKQVGAAFGTLFAIKIAKDIATKIFSFASGIGSLASKLLNFPLDTASSLPTIIGDIGGAAETAGNGGFTTLAEKIKNLGDVAQTAGGQFQGFWGYATNLGATAFVVEGLGQVKKAMDFKDSTADAFNDFEVVRKALKIIEEQTGISGDKLIGLGGDLKNVKDNAFDFDGQLQTVETSLENLGISSDTFKQALKQAMEESDTSTNSHVSNINEYIGTMGTEFDNAKSALERLSDQAVITPSQFDELSTVLQQQESSGATARAAFQALMDKMAEMGIDTRKVIKAFSEDVPKASSTMSKSVATASESVSSKIKTGFGLANTAVSTAMAGMKKSTESTMPSIWSKIKNTNDDVETNSKTNWGNSASAVSTALGTMDTDTKDIMGKVMTTIQSYWSSVLINTNQIWEKASGKVDTETENMKTYTESNLSGISDYITSLFKNDLTSMGRETAQSFANGMKQVRLPTLTYRISEWRKHNLGNGKTSSTPVYKPNWYAKGGLFNGAQVIGIGEAGSEAVLPLENPRTMKKIADSIVSSSDGSMGLTKEEMAKAVAQGVAMAMSMNSGNKNPQYIMNSIILDGSEIAKAVTKAQNDTDSRFKPSPAY
uniref:Minor tail protein n=1 Tax=Siphoviridae sp. ctVif31 TaxID=2825532 RepID=A0A8S5Q2H1_9CAUD|nr:MAG TPA: minor tail protein [Siphoviridae sp. ctVif31]